MVGKFEDACGTVGRNPAEVRKSLQFGWESEEPGDLIELSGKYYELGVTEQVIYLRGDHPERTAEKIAELLPELRRLEAVRS